MSKLQIISELFGDQFCPHLTVFRNFEIYYAIPKKSALISSSDLQSIINKAAEFNARISYTSDFGFLVTFN